MSAVFQVSGPYEITTERRRGGRIIPRDLNAFWGGEAASCRSNAGCYVFSISWGQKYVPFYVGMSCRTFEKECFTPDKRVKYSEVIMTYPRHKPVMFFLCMKRGRGKLSGKAIGHLEELLIGAAWSQNTELVNIKKRPKEHIFEIEGILPIRPGRRSSAAELFASSLGLFG